MFGLSAILAVVQGVGMFYLPTSPRWLISKGREDEVSCGNIISTNQLSPLFKEQCLIANTLLSRLVR